MRTTAPSHRTFGHAPLPHGHKVALFCSVKCPGALILATYDLAARFRDDGIAVIGGFHSPMEQECLRILLRGRQPVVWCLARNLYRRLPPQFAHCRAAVSDGRLVIASPFPDSVREPTTDTATFRNRFVAELATVVVVAHAAPGGKSEALCRDLLAANKPLYTFDHPANAALVAAGARTITPATDWKAIVAREHHTCRASVPALG